MWGGFLIGVVVLAGLACPLLMMLGRRGIGPGCALMDCTPEREEETLESLRAQQQGLARRIAAFEARESAPPNQLERV